MRSWELRGYLMIEDLTESFIPVCNTITPTILILTNFLKMPR